MPNTPYRPELLYKQIAYCTHSDCPLSHHCLRQIAYQASPTFYEAPFIDPRLPQGAACERYLDDSPIRYARGFRRGISRLRHGDVGTFQSRFCYEFGCRKTTYYDIVSGKRRLNPKEQEIVTALFSELGIEPSDLFDSYEEGYILD